MGKSRVLKCPGEAGCVISSHTQSGVGLPFSKTYGTAL